ncbi:MAG: 1-acyl-sn-glycerol-3-phosphate acyltransferase [Bradyrhizobiaceae bacterium]|nr:MAG: 1-acyl-sn-glycerol-3-phosphate acyltransferase [Bradyrhizobiaceae bacterium]
MIRIAFILLALVFLFLVLVPFQIIGIAFDSSLQRSVPVLFHRMACKILGVRIREIGERTQDRPALILSNHASWLDISVLGAVAPLVFVSKSEVANWPIFGMLAKLQRTIFIERERRHKTGDAAQSMAERLRGGDAVLLFPEGTSSDGIRTLPFRSALIGAVHHAIGDSSHHDRVTVQPVSLAYVQFGGIQIGRGLRDKVAWYGETELVPHLLGVIAQGAVDVTVTWGEPVAYGMNADRKQIARDAENAVRRMTAAALRGQPPRTQTSPETQTEAFGVPAQA